MCVTDLPSPLGVLLRTGSGMPSNHHRHLQCGLLALLLSYGNGGLFLPVWMGGKMPAYSAQRPAQYYERDVITDWPRGPRPSAKNDEFTRKAQSRGRPIVRAVSRLFIAVLIVNPTLGKGRQCPLWVKSRHLQRKKTCPLCPRKRTCAVQLGMSALCQ